MAHRHKHDPIYVISVAAQLADMHPQTLRQYDRMGLVVPARQAGGQRRYSTEDVRLLRRIQSLSRDGVSLEGVRRIVELEAEVDQLRDTVGELVRSEEHTSELQSRGHLVCRLLPEITDDTIAQRSQGG